MFEIDENSILRLRKFVFLKCFRQDAFKMFQERLQDPSRRPKGAQHGPRSPSKASPRPRPKAGFHGCCWLQAFKTLQERPQDPSRWPKDVLKGLWGELPRVVSPLHAGQTPPDWIWLELRLRCGWVAASLLDWFSTFPGLDFQTGLLQVQDVPRWPR